MDRSESYATAVKCYDYRAMIFPTIADDALPWRLIEAFWVESSNVFTEPGP